MAQRVRLTLQYDGTDFAGWQLQPGQRTVQGVVEAAAARLLSIQDRVQVDASGRTDAGVHARQQVVALDDPRALPLVAWGRGLNAELPDDVAVTGAEHVGWDFDPRRDARGKRYIYRIWNGPTRRPLLRRDAWWVELPLDVEAMRAAAPALLGEHDFTSFRAARCNARSPVRHLHRIEVDDSRAFVLSITVEGNAFLRHMVRILVGTLVEVGEGRRDPSSLKAVLAEHDRLAAGRTAAPEGLTLDTVYYGG